MLKKSTLCSTLFSSYVTCKLSIKDFFVSILSTLFDDFF